MRRFRHLSALALILVFCSCGNRKTAPEGQTAAVDTVADRIARVETGLLPAVVRAGEIAATAAIAGRMDHFTVPGAVVAVVSNGAVEWVRSYGVTDVESAAPVADATLFQAASISKPVSAVLALRLVQEDLLELDRDVNEYLVSWKLPTNELTEGNPVTIAQLLSHSAGLGISGFPGYPRGTPLPSLQQILDGEPPANTGPVRVQSRPGTTWSYSGGGYCVLQQLIEDVTGRPFPDLVQEYVLDPLGMSSSVFEYPLPPEFVASAASGHTTMGQPVEGGWHDYPELGAAGLWSTATDLARFVIGVQAAAEGEDGAILEPELARLLVRQWIGDWSLGLNVGDANGRAFFRHSGGNAGFRCLMFGNLSNGTGAVVMTNSDNGDMLITEIFAAIGAEYGWSQYRPRVVEALNLDEDELAMYAGTYTLPGAGLQAQVEVAGRDLVVTIPGMHGGKLVPVEIDRFVQVDRGWEVEFPRNDKGEVAEFVVDAGSFQYRLTR